MKRSKNLLIEEESEEGGDELMASFADMMTLLLGFFMILYSLSFDDDRKFYEFGKAISANFSKNQNAEDQTSVVEESDYKREARAFQMLAAVLNLGENNQALQKTEDLYTEKLKAQIAKKTISEKSPEMMAVKAKIKHALDQESNIIMDIIIPSKELFASGSTKISNHSKHQLIKLALLLEKIKTVGRFNIIGHTDSIPIRSRNHDNWSLSTDRATSVARELIKYGIPENKIAITGRAGTNPLYPEYTPDGKLIKANLAKNRRIEIQIERQVR